VQCLSFFAAASLHDERADQEDCSLDPGKSTVGSSSLLALKNDQSKINMDAAGARRGCVPLPPVDPNRSKGQQDWFSAFRHGQVYKEEFELRTNRSYEVFMRTMSAMASAHNRSNGTNHTWHSEVFWMAFVNRTRSIVQSWPFISSPGKATDKVAVIVFQPPGSIDQVEYVIRSNSHRLGPEWAIQVFYGTEESREALSSRLGENVIWSHLTIAGQVVNATTLLDYNWLRLSPDFWSAISPQHEHVLIFEPDSMIIRKGCVDNFLDYDYVGAPWGLLSCSLVGTPADYGGNGGLVLRRRSSSLAAVTSEECSCRRGPSPSECPDCQEDAIIVPILKDRNASFPSREQATRFAVEGVFYPTPCGIHKPWPNFNLTILYKLFSAIDMS